MILFACMNVGIGVLIGFVLGFWFAGVCAAYLLRQRSDSGEPIAGRFHITDMEGGSHE